MPLEVVTWVDPGGTTGLARVFHVGTEVQEVELAQVGGEHVALDDNIFDTIQWIRGTADGWPRVPMTVGVEDFNSSGPLTTHAKDTIILVGAVRGVCAAYGYTLRVVAPAARKSALRRAATHGARIHETDALAHCYAYLRRER